MMNGTLHSVKVCNVALWMDFYTKSKYVMYHDELSITLSQSMYFSFMNRLLH